MTDRRTLLLDAALDVVGSQGLRALTHRAVDAAAGLPAGSASNVFRNRADLVAALLDRLLEREIAAWEGLVAAVDPPGSLHEAVAATAGLLGQALRTFCGPARDLTLARQALFHEAALDPELQRRVTAARARLTVTAREWFDRLGMRVDDAGLALVLATANGLLSNQVAGPEPDFDPERAMWTVLDAVARPREEER